MASDIDIIEGTVESIDPARSISNSEVSAYLSCERKWYYAHSLNLMPKKYGTALTRGIIGHECLAEYYQSLKDGQTVAEARRNANTVLAGFLQQSDDPDLTNILLALSTLLQNYFEWCASQDNFEILAVEKKYELPLTPEYKYALRLDLLVRMPTGHIVLIDHKFVYDFWQPAALDLNAQMPKYIGTLRMAGINVDRVMINQLRWRLKKDATWDDMFKRVETKYQGIEIQTMLREHIQTSQEIMALRALPLEKQSEKVKRNMGVMNCKMCSFRDLCKADLMGTKTALMIDTHFKPNDYDYNDKVALQND